MAARARHGWTVLAIGLAACAAPPEAPQDYLDRPFFQFSTGGGACTRVVAVDGLKQGWQQNQCGGVASGYQQTRVLSDAEFAQIQTAFDALPAQTDPACADDFLQPGIATFLRRGTASSDITWTACVSGNELAAPYLTPVTLLKQFVERP